MRSGNDPASRSLAEDLGEAHNGNNARANDVGKDLAGPDRGKLVDVTDDQQGCAIGNRFHQRLHQHDVNHRSFVDDEKVAFERVLGSPLEAEALGIELQMAMDGFGLHAGRLGHALGCPPHRGTLQEVHPLGGEDSQDRVDDGCLADAGTAGDDGHLGAKG